MENQAEIWQTEFNGEIYEANFGELVVWIAEGSLLPQDRVRRGNLRWIEAEKVPALYGFFNAKAIGVNSPVVTTSSGQTSAEAQQVHSFNVNQTQPVSQNFNEPPPPTIYNDLSSTTEKNHCVIHTDAPARYSCETCDNFFCKACPNNKVCPMCGAICTALEVQMPPILPYLMPQISANQEIIVSADVRKAAHWFYWKAGMTVINSILVMAGTYWQFFLGLTIPQLLGGLVIGISEMSDGANLGVFHGIILVISLFSAGVTALFGYKAGQGKKWGFVLGIIIFSFDALLYLVTLSFLGVIIHIIAIYTLCKGYASCSAKK